LLIREGWVVYLEFGDKDRSMKKREKRIMKQEITTEEILQLMEEERPATSS